MHARVVLGVGKGVLYIERCPHFRSVLIERGSTVSYPSHKEMSYSTLLLTFLG